MWANPCCSTNWWASRLSIVEDTPGVTRDRLYAECEWRGRTFDIVDTGGIEPGTDHRDPLLHA